jgi:plasmid stabilization system protein ParE
VSSYKLTRKAEADLEALTSFSIDRFGADAAVRFVDMIERHLKALARHEYEGPQTFLGSRTRPVRRWPVPPFWLYYDRVGGVLRVLRIYHGARGPL